MIELRRWMGAGLLLGSLGCGEGQDAAREQQLDPSGADATVALPVDQGGGGGEPPRPGTPSHDAGPDAAPGKPDPVVQPVDPSTPGRHSVAKLVVASDCTDLLTRIQDDAIAKLKLQVEQYKKQPTPGRVGPRVADAGAVFIGPVPAPSRDNSIGGLQGNGAEKGGVDGPTRASDTNKQVGDVDEADFVKVVESGKRIYLLHGSKLFKLDSWPPAQTALRGSALEIEGSPSEMFVSDEGKAVIFSNVYGYGGYGGPYPLRPAIDLCAPGYCGGTGKLKVTVADVTGDTPKVERELYYEGNYLSSRRYDDGTRDVVRAIIQAPNKSSGLYTPDIEWSDPWGEPYPANEIASQLDEWAQRTTNSIRKTTLEDWLPSAQEAKAGKLVDLAPSCNSYFVPEAGLSESGLTHVLALDVAQPGAPVSGITIVGGASTVYSNSNRLVLAQPDYRWSPFRELDFGVAPEQQTALHVFELSADSTKYLASGWVFGALPRHNPQFGVDVAADGTVRVATTGFVRKHPTAKPGEPSFWERTTENYVLTARASGDKLEVIGKSPKLGLVDESIFSARFVGNRAYVVTARQTDPLIVVDLANAAQPAVLGQIKIPGFSTYMHPLDEGHIITVGDSGSGSTQLQLFDVRDPANIPQPKVLDFGEGSSTAVSYDHKAFTFFDGLLALPMYSYGYGARYEFSSGLQVVRVDAATGFRSLAMIDHARLYANNGAGVICGSCDAVACYDYSCDYMYRPEVRRGHFVQGDGKTYVYSFSHAGVLVHDLASPRQSVARVGLPQPLPNNGPWYAGPNATPGLDAGVPIRPRDAGVPIRSRDAGVTAAPTP